MKIPFLLLLYSEVTQQLYSLSVCYQGRIQDFKLGGAHLKKLRRAERGANFFGVFRVNNHDFTPTNLIFSNFRWGGGGGGGREPRWIRPCIKTPCVFSHLYLSVCVFKECSYMWDNL